MIDALPLPPEAVLFINVSRIGDTLLATPAICALAAHWPQAQIDVLAHPKREEVVRYLPFVHATRGITKLRAPFMGWLGGKRYQLAVVYNYDQALIDYALRVADRVVAFRQSDDALNAKLFRAVDKAPPRSEHAVDEHLRLTDALGIPHAGKALAYCVLPEEKAWAAGFLAERGIAGRHPLIGLQVASFPTKAWRDWPLDSFAELCRRIHGKWPTAHFLIFGGALKQEREKTSALAATLGEHATLCAGQLSLRQTAALMSTTDLYVGVDTGPTHLMGALHRPMVALYHCHSSSKLYGPLDHPCAQIVDHPRLGQAVSPEIPMAEITVDTVWDAVRGSELRVESREGRA